MRIRVSHILSGIGLTVIAAGVIFILQSAGAVGPDTSFMVRNPAWTGYGIWIVLGGLAITIIGRLIQD
jgi:hypothetical protein